MLPPLSTSAPGVTTGRFRRRCCRPHSGGGRVIVTGSNIWQTPSALPAAAGWSYHTGAGAVSCARPPPLPTAAALLLLTMVELGLSRSPWSVVKVLGTGSILAELAAILAKHSWTVRKDGTARTPEERTGQGQHAFLLHLALGEVPVPGLERVTLVGVDEDGRVHLMHSLFSIRVNVYSTDCRLFACVGELPHEGLPQVIEILPDFFMARHSVYAVPRIDHISHLGRISPRDW